MWTIITRIILRNKIPLLIGILFLTGFMIYFGTKVEMTQSYTQVIPEDDVDFIKFKEFGKEFGDEATVLVAAVERKNFFTPKFINQFHQLSINLEKIDGVDDCLNFTNAAILEKNEQKKKFELDAIFTKDLKTQDQADQFKKLLLSQKFYHNLFFNDKQNLSLLAVNINSEKLNSKEKKRIVNEIVRQIDKFGKKTSSKVHYSGLPYIRNYIANEVPKQIGMFIGLATLITAIILFIFFRSINAVIFPLILIGLSVAWSFGWIGILGYKVTLLSGLIPPLLVIIGIPNSIYLFNKYHSEYKKSGNKIKAISLVIKKIGLVTLMINGNTAFAFLTLYFTQVRPLMEFGLVAFLSTFSIFFISIILIPSVFTFLPPPKEKSLRHLDSATLNKFLDNVIQTVKRHRGIIFSITGGLVAFAIYGFIQLDVVSHVTDDLPKNRKVYDDLLLFEKEFGGVMPFEIVIDTKKKGGARKYKMLKKIEKLQEKLATYDEFSKSMSIVDLLKWTRQAWFNGDPKFYELPNTAEFRVYYRYMRKSKSMNNIKITDSSMQKARITLNIKDVGSKEIPSVIKKVNNDINTIFDGMDIDATITGTTRIFLKSNDYLVSNLIYTVIATLILISLQMHFLFRSFRITIISVSANIIPLMLITAIMGVFGIAIKPSTVMIFGVAFSIAIDDSIHYLSAYRAEKLKSSNIPKAVINSLRETGLNIIYTSIILLLGFVVFAISPFGGIQAIGLLTSITLLMAMFANLFLLPSLLITFDKAPKNIEKVGIDEI